MKDTRLHVVVRQTLGIICVVLLLVFPTGALVAQQPAPPAVLSAPAQPLSPDQLDTLVAPIALYPDPLLSQVLVASTYPLEVVEAEQWLQRNGNLKGQQLTDAARQQNWDASVQALVALPDVLAKLNQDVEWTTALGNAFLAQQSDVMTAVQRMRARAQANGRLSSTPQQTVTTESQGGQTAIEIAPADPQVIYVPAYDPMYVWGPPAWGYYPPLYYGGYGFGFYPGIDIGFWFGGWGGWGWGRTGSGARCSLTASSSDTTVSAAGYWRVGLPAERRGNMTRATVWESRTRTVNSLAGIRPRPSLRGARWQDRATSIRPARPLRETGADSDQGRRRRTGTDR